MYILYPTLEKCRLRFSPLFILYYFCRDRIMVVKHAPGKLGLTVNLIIFLCESTKVSLEVHFSWRNRL